ncbi:hypothetical protein EIM44_03035 [Bibersteinia trehalosi]|uniref:Uncharacterized protein n=1 Tax=Bibersteinia trehalosi TaxID=47735 RepID=A0A3R8SR83_BIBTR|nr:hypothetical protein [Bibersteinia trehalosi]RRN04432.1 hypothetical protein EIM44_03035 [Bibersteinia trehalosi]
MKNTVNDKDAEQLRKEIKDLIKSLDMNQKEAADVVAEDLGREDNFYESFRQDLKRCKSIEKLTNYLNILKSSEKYLALHKIQARYEGDVEVLGVEMQRAIHRISKQIADHIEKQEAISAECEPTQ